MALGSAANFKPRLLGDRLYMRGDVVELALGESFGRPSHHADIDPRGSEVEALVAAVSARRAAAPDIRLEFA